LKFHSAHGALLGFAFAVTTFSFSGGAFAFDEEAVMALTKKSDCTKCHAADKDKIGPSYKKIAAKYKGKADAEEKVTKTITTASKVKLANGTELDHKTVNTKDAKEIKNLAQWILAQ
jgi:cytochrome c